MKKLLTAITTVALAAAPAMAQNDLLTPERLWSMGRIGSYSEAPNGTQAVFCVTTYSKKDNNSRSTIYMMDIYNNDPTALTPYGKSETSPVCLQDGRVAFLAAGDVWVMDADGKNRKQVTKTDGHVNEFLFSPDMKSLIAVMEVPQHTSIAEKEKDLPLASGMVINDLMYKHWDHFVTSAPHPILYRVEEVGATRVADLLEGEPYESPMEPFGGIEQLAWSPDSRYVAYTCRKKTGRDYATSTDSDIYLYDTQSKTTKNLCKENQQSNRMAVQTDYTHSLAEQPVNKGAVPFPGYDDNPAFSPDGKYIAFRSMARDGYESDRARLCIMNLATGEHSFVTEDLGPEPGSKDKTTRQSGVEDYCWGHDNNTIYFTAVWHGRTNVYTTNLQGKVQQLTNDICDYSIGQLSRDGQRLWVKRHSLSQADELYLINIARAQNTVKSGKPNYVTSNADNGAAIRQVTHINQQTYDRLKFGEVKERWTKTVDGKDMLSWVVYPPHFDANKKYPVLLFCEGGPQSPVSQFWSYRWNFQIMAANGYIVIAPNRRGLPGFGMEWLEEISGDYTGLCMQDYLSAIDDIAKEPYVDKDHMGAVGASFGGFSVYWLAGNHDKRFKAFIAHDGIYNTQQQYVETEEQWFTNWDLGSAPWYRNSEGQMQKAFEQSPHLYVQNWDTPILCIHGQKDYRIEYTQAESAFTAARLRGLEAQLLLFPDENHWVLKPQNGILWQRTFFRFLDKHLK